MVQSTLYDLLQSKRDVGNGELLVGGRNPDFVCDISSTVVVEMFGDYYHNPTKTGVSREEHERERVQYFKDRGYVCIVVWGSDLEDPKVLSSKLRQIGLATFTHQNN
jgi:very-short-patch-repair endonuclease